MPLYAGIDLHANNNYLAVIDDDDRVVQAKRNRNDLGCDPRGTGATPATS